MHRLILLGLLSSLTIAPAVLADGGPPWDFEYTANGGVIADDTVQWFPLDVTDPLEVIYMELEITGLTHNAPGDLWAYLLDPFGGGIMLMDDTGDQLPIDFIDVVFSDKGDPLPGDGQLLHNTLYAPMGPGTFSQYYFANYGVLHPGTWRLVMTDDSPGEGGTFESFTLRGGIVPEPMTLSMLVLGAAVALRRKRS